MGPGAKLKALHSVEGEDGKVRGGILVAFECTSPTHPTPLPPTHQTQDATVVGATFIMLHLRLTVLEENNDEKQFEVTTQIDVHPSHSTRIFLF